MPLTEQGRMLLEKYRRRGAIGLAEFYIHAARNDGFINDTKVFTETAVGTGAVATADVVVEPEEDEEDKEQDQDDQRQVKHGVILGDMMKDDLYEELMHLWDEDE